MGKAKKLAANRPNPATHDPKTQGNIRAEPLVLIVCPTRELATQIFDEARKLAYRTMLRPAVVYGGGPIPEQIAQLAKGADILIGTPGRLIDFINRPHLLTLSRLKYMVIDEADEMLHDDWQADLNQIMSGGGEYFPQFSLAILRLSPLTISPQIKRRATLPTCCFLQLFQRPFVIWQSSISARIMFASVLAALVAHMRISTRR